MIFKKKKSHIQDFKMSQTRALVLPYKPTTSSLSHLSKPKMLDKIQKYYNLKTIRSKQSMKVLEESQRFPFFFFSLFSINFAARVAQAGN